MASAPNVPPGSGLVAIAVAIAIGSAAPRGIGGALPSRSGTSTTVTRESAQITALIADLRFARAQAIKQKGSVVTCASSDGATCSNSNDWELGWMVCLDVNNSASCDAGNPVYRVQKAFDRRDSFSASGNTSAILFNREGFAVGLAGDVTITLHDASGDSSYTRCVEISAVGTLQVQKAGIGSCR